MGVGAGEKIMVALFGDIEYTSYTSKEDLCLVIVLL
ncbi:MAG: hypothetical protein ACI8RD_005954 [Bacillariaceae sp.]|jgi:hypothetical protein